MRAFLIVSQKDRLDEQQCKYVEQIRQGHPDLEMAYQLGQGFVMMLAEQRGGDLDTWLTQAEHSGLASIQKNGERDSPRLCSSQNGVYFRVEQWAGGSAGQLLKASKTDRIREGQLRFTAAARSLPCVASIEAGGRAPA